MSASPLDAFQSVLQDEVTRQTELRVKETMAELLGGIAREFGLAVVPMVESVKPVETVEPVKVSRPKLTPKTAKLIDWTEIDRAATSYRKNVSRGPASPAHKRAVKRFMKAVQAVREEYGVTYRMIGARTGFSESTLYRATRANERVDTLRLVG